MAMRNRDEPGNFVNYLPQDEAVVMRFGPGEHCVDFMESQRSVDLLNRELSLLLKLNHDGFWTAVKEDISLIEFLDSFLQFRSRWYDFPHHGHMGTCIIIGESELARRVFMVLYRMSLNNIGDEHKVIVNWKGTERNIMLNLSTLLDICGIYFHENPLLTTSLVNNAIKSIPESHCDFVPLMYNFFNMFYTMNQRCRTTLQVMDFLNDAVVSMDCLVHCYEPAAALFCCPIEMSYGTEELIILLATSHDSLIPTMEQGLRTEIRDGHENNEDRQLSDICVRLKLLSLRIVKFGWKLLESCFLDGNTICESSHSTVTKIFPAYLEDPIVRADILVQTFRSISGVSSEIGKGRTFLQSIENCYGIMSRIEHLAYKGWISTDSEQMEYLKGIISPASHTNTDSETSKILKEGDGDVIWESKLSQIRDIFPDVGKEFLSTCLKVCDNNPELVIQRILDGALHETSPEILHFSTQYKNNNKRKEKVIECNRDNKEEKVMKCKGQLPPFNGNFNSAKMPSMCGGSCSSSPPSGRYVRKQKNMEIAEINKFDIREMKDSKRLAAIISRYEYEDEYDDSFDELGLTVDSGFNDDEIIVEQQCSTLSSENVINQPASNQKWKSQKKPQFYVKDGRNYSYNVAGSTAAWNANEAFFVSRVQKELIHGLGHGGNIPIRAMEKPARLTEEEGDKVGSCINELQVKKGATHTGKHGGGRNHSRKDRALRKHISSLGGF